MKNYSLSPLMTLTLAFGFAFSSASLLAQSTVNASVVSPVNGAITSEVINDHALHGEMTTFHHQDGRVAAIIFTNKDGQIVALPKVTIDRINELAGEQRGAMPNSSSTVTLLYNLPGGGSVYEVSNRGVPLGLLIVQPNGHVTYVAY